MQNELWAATASSVGITITFAVHFYYLASHGKEEGLGVDGQDSEKVSTIKRRPVQPGSDRS